MNESRNPQNDEQLDALVREIASGYNEPPHELDAQRRERIFARIQEARQTGVRRRIRAPRPSGRMWLQAAAMAAVLLLGIGIGRWSPPAPGPGATGPDRVSDASGSTQYNVYRLAARAYLERTENLLLTLQRAAYAPEPNTPWGTATAEPTVGWAHDLLRETRLLQDSPAAKDDPQLSQLLEDLELLLAQIVQATKGNDALESSPVTDPGVLQRVRSELERTSLMNEI